jgi:hypothetical protein
MTHTCSFLSLFLSIRGRNSPPTLQKCKPLERKVNESGLPGKRHTAIITYEPN